MLIRRPLPFAIGIVLLLAHLTFGSGNGVTWAAAMQSQVIGRWQGKFPLPDDISLAEADNPVAVELLVKEDSGKLFGTVTFYVIRNKDNKPQIVGKKETEMIAPQFDSQVLRFGVKMKGSQPGTETTVEMRMTLKSDTEAELENHDDASAQVFKLKKMG